MRVLGVDGLEQGRDLTPLMRVLTQAGLVIPKRIKQWTFYRRDEAAIAALKAAIAAKV